MKGFIELESSRDLMITLMLESLSYTSIRKLDNLKGSDTHTENLKSILVLSQIKRPEDEKVRGSVRE